MIGAEILPNLDSLTLTERLLGSVTTPTLFLWGANDGFGKEDNARLVTGWMPNADLVMIPEAGHLPWLDDPALAANETSSFLSGHTDPHRAPRTADAATMSRPVESGDQP